MWHNNPYINKLKISKALKIQIIYTDELLSTHCTGWKDDQMIWATREYNQNCNQQTSLAGLRCVWQVILRILPRLKALEVDLPWCNRQTASFWTRAMWDDSNSSMKLCAQGRKVPTVAGPKKKISSCYKSIYWSDIGQRVISPLRIVLVLAVSHEGPTWGNFLFGYGSHIFVNCPLDVLAPQ